MVGMPYYAVMTTIIHSLGGPTVVARMLGIKVPSVIGWAGRIPADRCPAIERAVAGRVTCEELRPDVRWQRVPDAAWPHPGGRPCIDVAAPACTDTRAVLRSGAAVNDAGEVRDVA